MGLYRKIVKITVFDTHAIATCKIFYTNAACFFSYIRNIHAYADTQISPRANPRASNSAFCTLAVKIILQYYLPMRYL